MRVPVEWMPRGAGCGRDGRSNAEEDRGVATLERLKECIYEYFCTWREVSHATEFAHSTAGLQNGYGRVRLVRRRPRLRDGSRRAALRSTVNV
jgi:hypothetical protein